MANVIRDEVKKDHETVHKKNTVAFSQTLVDRCAVVNVSFCCCLCNPSAAAVNYSWRAAIDDARQTVAAVNDTHRATDPADQSDDDMA